MKNIPRTLEEKKTSFIHLSRTLSESAERKRRERKKKEKKLRSDDFEPLRSIEISLFKQKCRAFLYSQNYCLKEQWSLKESRNFLFFSNLITIVCTIE